MRVMSQKDIRKLGDIQMAHMLETDENGVTRMFSTRMVSWHGLGQVLDNPPTSAEAIKAAGMDWKVQRRAINPGLLLDDQDMPILGSELPDNAVSDIPRVLLLRDIDNKWLGSVSQGYKPLQNSEAFGFFDTLVAQGLAQYETAGVIMGGKRIWIQAAMTNKVQVAKEDYRQYVLLTNGHDGVSGVTIQPVHMRVVCNNTMQIALREGGIHWFAHRGDVAGNIEQAKEFMGLINKEFDSNAAGLEAMTAIKMDEQAINAFLVDLLKLPKVELPADDATSDQLVMQRLDTASVREQAMFDKIKELHEAGTGMTGETRGTAYGVFNAVVEFADYFAGARSRDRVNYVLFGDGADLKKEAATKLLELV